MIIPFYATIALATDPVTDAVTAMTGLANAYDTTGTSPVNESGPARLRPSTFEDRLREAQGLLEGEGCTVDASGWLGGAYRANVAGGVSGEDQAGSPLQGRVSASTKQVSGTLGGDPVGGAVGSVDGRSRFVMDRDGTTFYVGQAARVQGARGVFMGIEADCPTSASPETALAGWFSGDATGLDALTGTGPPAVPLVGTWSVAMDCPTVFDGNTITNPDTWTVSGEWPTLSVSTLTGFVTDATVIYVLGEVDPVYAISGQGFAELATDFSGPPMGPFSVTGDSFVSLVWFQIMGDMRLERCTITGSRM